MKKKLTAYQKLKNREARAWAHFEHVKSAISGAQLKGLAPVYSRRDLDKAEDRARVASIAADRAFIAH